MERIFPDIYRFTARPRGAEAAREGVLVSFFLQRSAGNLLLPCGDGGDNVDLPCDSYRPLHFAVRGNRPEAVALLLRRGAHVMDEFLLNAINQSLRMARELGYEDVYELLDADRRARFGYRAEAEAVGEAIKARDLDAVLKLLDADATLVDATDQTGNAPIHWAVLTRQWTMIQALSQRGANLDHTRFDGTRPIDLVSGDYWFNHSEHTMEAALQEPVALLGFLLGLGAEYGMCTAIRLGDAERVEALVAAEPHLANALSNDPQPPSSAGEHGRQRPIVVAAQTERVEIARMLIQAGADVNLGVPLWSPYGQALFAACARGNLTMAEMFLESGARPNVEVESSGDCFSIMEGLAPSRREEMRALLRLHGGISVHFGEEES